MTSIWDQISHILVAPTVAVPATAEILSVTSNFFTATVNSLMMILVTEIGDKTFFIAAVLAMRHGRLIVYAGAMAALTFMHILSSLMGFALPSLIPRAYTHTASTLLFVYFGCKLLRDSCEMNSGGPSDELQEVEEELEKKKAEGAEADDEPSVGDVEAGSGKTNSPKKKSFLQSFGAENLRIFTQAFTLTFLAEWGDRSQIATIALAASKNPFGVVIGGLIGHAFCTGLAVIGGRMLAARISEKTVAVIGGLSFLFFALTSFLFGPDADF